MTTNALPDAAPSSLAPPQGDRAALAELTAALQVYFDCMHDCDVARLDAVFAPTCHLHGFRDGVMQSWSMPVYRDILGKRVSPRALGAPREDAILLVDLTSPTMAFTKVRLRINTMIFVDDLTWHRVDGRWLITSKGFHLDAQLEA